MRLCAHLTTTAALWATCLTTSASAQDAKGVQDIKDTLDAQLPQDDDGLPDYRHYRAQPPFKTEPTFKHTYLVVGNITESQSLLGPGYLFLDPVHGALKMGIDDIGPQYGPEIREFDGTLVWYGGVNETYGSHALTRQRVQDFHVVDHLGVKGRHLGWSEKVTEQERKHVIIDDTYSIVEELITGLKGEPTNMHEFNVVDDGNSYIHTIWPVEEFDLRPFNGPQRGSVKTACFQEISMKTHVSMFDWCWVDYYSVGESLVPLGLDPDPNNATTTKFGSGAPGDGWDPHHMNAIDKNLEGDYLVSVRHADQILLIAGLDNVHGVEPGTTLWRFGGPGNMISIEGEAFTFSRQHGVRFIATTEDEVIFMILDNAWDGAMDPSSTSSTGKIISVNNSTMTARLLRQYPMPTGRLCPSQGNIDILANENVWISWGSCAEVSEFTHDGQLLYHAVYTNWTAPEQDHAFTFSYRVFKAPWVGRPQWRPKLIAYASSCQPGEADTGSLHAWVSWNGATEVKSYRFSASNVNDGLWIPLGVWSKTGFETEVVLSDLSPIRLLNSFIFPRYIFVEALDANGNVIEHGEQMTEVFVPGEKVKDKCNNTGCVDGFNYFDKKLSVADQCSSTRSTNMLPQIVALTFLVLILEYLDYSYIWIFIMFVSRWSRDQSSDDEYDGDGEGEAVHFEHFGNGIGDTKSAAAMSQQNYAGSKKSLHISTSSASEPISSNHRPRHSFQRAGTGTPV